MQWRVTSVLLIFLTLACGQKPKAEAQNDKDIVCFVYHRFGDDRFPSTNVSLENFRLHLQYLKDQDFQVLSFSEAIDYVQSGEPSQKTAVITIDDGYTSFYEKGLPLLKEFGYPATLFINTETVGGKDYMDWAQLKEAQQAGIEIGNHTHTHAYFLNLPEAERYEAFRKDLKKCQELIADNLGSTPTAFAYPFGEYDLKMKEIVAELGFKAAAAQNSGVIHAGTDLMLCPRFPMSEAYAAPDKFASKAQMNALEVPEVSPKSPILSSDQAQPELSVKTNNADLQLNQLQCFIQGSECEIVQKENGTVVVKAASNITNRRRTLYTLTVPDKDGNWHWFSHLWINPKVGE